MIIKKVLFFHNVVLPLLTFLVSFSSLFMYGFSIKGLLNLIIMVYSLFVIGFANTYNQCLLKKMKELRNEKAQSSDIYKSIN